MSWDDPPNTPTIKNVHRIEQHDGRLFFFHLLSQSSALEFWRVKFLQTEQEWYSLSPSHLALVGERYHAFRLQAI
jgi:hypothetical protein